MIASPIAPPWPSIGAGGSVSRTMFEPEPGWRARSGDVGAAEQPMRPKAAAAARTAMTTRVDFMREPHEMLRGVVRETFPEGPGGHPTLKASPVPDSAPCCCGKQHAGPVHEVA